jgi:hypothetical protein
MIYLAMDVTHLQDQFASQILADGYEGVEACIAAIKIFPEISKEQQCQCSR